MVAKNTGTINVSLSASSPEELAKMVAELAKAFGGYDKLAEKITTAGANTDPLTGSSTAALDVAVNEPEPERDPIPAEPAEDKVPAQNVVKDKNEVATVRDEAIQKLTEYFGKNPQAINDLASMQKKFGVRLFKDIPDDRVSEFAQDAHMLINGTVEG